MVKEVRLLLALAAQACQGRSIKNMDARMTSLAMPPLPQPLGARQLSTDPVDKAVNIPSKR